MERLGEKLRALRNAHGYTLRQLDKMLQNASYGHLGNLEKGRKRPSVELLMELCRTYEVTPNHLLLDDWEIDEVLPTENSDNEDA